MKRRPKVSPSAHHVRVALRLKECARKNREEDRAHELKGTLFRLHYRGICAHCGLMLTERDKNRGKKTHTCPRCGKSGYVAESPAQGTRPATP